MTAVATLCNCLVTDTDAAVVMQVIHLAQACIQNDEFQRHVKGYEAATTIGDALKEQLSLTYRLTSGQYPLPSCLSSPMHHCARFPLDQH